MPLSNEFYWLVAKRFLSLLFGAFLVAVLVYVAFIVSSSGGKPEDTLIVREVNVAALPPPPPPPQREKLEEMDVALSENLMLQGAGPKVPFVDEDFIEVDKDVDVASDIQIRNVDWEGTFKKQYQEVELQELDEIPRLVSSSQIRIPYALRQKGIKKVVAQLLILIDEKGSAHIQKILALDHVEMEKAIRQYIKSAVFTPPKKNGYPVYASYRWTVRFIEE